MKRKYFYALILLIAAILLPKDVLADGKIEVRLREGFGGEVIGVVEADENVTTFAQIRALFKAKNIDVDSYVFVKNYDYDLYEDEDVIVCQEDNLTYCYGPVNELYFYLDALTVDDTEKNISIKSIVPTDEQNFMDLVETNYEVMPYGLSFVACDDTFELCSAVDYMKDIYYTNYNIEYVYDEDIQKLAQAIVDAGALDETSFEATDTELLHYLNYGGSLANYTSAFKAKIANTNFNVEMDERAGGDDYFETLRAGFYRFLYNETIYAVKPFVEISAPHILYVPDDTTDIKKAIEDRLDTLFGEENTFTVSKCDKTINEMLEEEGSDPIENGNDYCYILSHEEEIVVGYDEDGKEETVTEEVEYYFIIVKDSSKINNVVAFKSSDLVTNVSVSADQDVPLDTLVVVSKITSGDEYEGILKTLNLKEGETYEIDLHSNSQNRNITELPNGKFLVRIPIPDKYAESDKLVVYYVDVDKKVTEHTVEVKEENGKLFAEFETDHFSIYTLAEDNKEANPKTGDMIMTYITVGVVSTLCLGTGIFFAIKSKKKNNQ